MAAQITVSYSSRRSVHLALVAAYRAEDDARHMLRIEDATCAGQPASPRYVALQLARETVRTLERDRDLNG